MHLRMLRVYVRINVKKSLQKRPTHMASKYAAFETWAQFNLIASSSTLCALYEYVCMIMCVCKYISICIWTCPVYICMYEYVCMIMCVCIFMSICIWMCPVYIYMSISISISICICIYAPCKIDV